MLEKSPNHTSDRLDDPKTRWAYERTILANERTYIAWLRTGLAITGGSALFLRLLDGVEPIWLVDFLSIIMGLVGALIVIVSTWGYRKMHRKLDQIDPSFFPNWMVLLIVVALEMAMIAFLVLFLIG
jgi:putative membrane protein